MLTVPATIETLFKTDGIRKNFRVHFPNGENADLTNSDISFGSVKFTESICSKDVLQFGLAEASRIEFECVNVQNIYGMVIECGIEVDTSSLSAAQISAIQGNPGDGTLVLVGDSDIGYGFYRVPYGVFTVTSCPRSNGAKWKRRVEAYVDSGVSKTSVTRVKDSIPRENLNIYEPNLVCETAQYSSAILNDMTATQMTIVYATNLGGNYITDSSLPKRLVLTATNNSKQVSMKFSNSPEYYPSPMYLDDDTVYKIRLHKGTNYSDLYDICVDYADQEGLTVIRKDVDYQYSLYTGSLVAGGYAKGREVGEYVEFIVYPFLTKDQDTNNLMSIVANYGSYDLTLEIDSGGGTTTQVLDTLEVYDDIEITKYTTSVPNIKLAFESTGVFNNGNGDTYTFVDAYDVTALMEGYAELTGKYLISSRNGGQTLIALSQSSPISMNTTEYSDLWWDEYDIAPIGSVAVTYKDIDLDQEQTLVYEFGDGLSVYDMTDNYLLKNLAVSVNDLTNQTVEEFVTGLLDTYFIPNITDIAFTPVQLSSLGLPYLEAGDYLEIDDGNNGTVGTYIMSRTISGEQFLEDEIESQGGEIIGNARSA